MEYINANGTVYECQKIETESNAIVLTIDGKTEELKEAFKNVTNFTVSGKDNEAYGNYENLKYQSVTEYEDGTVTIKMKILSDMEIAVSDLQKTQAEQDDVIAELIGGGTDVK